MTTLRISGTMLDDYLTCRQLFYWRHLMETTPMGQTFYPQEANALFPQGCQCHDRSGSCDWCRVYYDGPEEAEEEDVG